MSVTGHGCGLPNHGTTEFLQAVFYMCICGMLPRTAVDIQVSWCTPKSPWSIYRYILLNCNSNSSLLVWKPQLTGHVKELATGFAFTNTDSDDVSRGCSLTVIVSVIVSNRSAPNTHAIKQTSNGTVYRRIYASLYHNNLMFPCKERTKYLSNGNEWTLKRCILLKILRF